MSVRPSGWPSAGLGPVQVAGVSDVEQEVPEVLYAVLDDEIDVHDVQVTRDHLGLDRDLRDGGSSAGPETELHAPGLLDGDDIHIADRRWGIPVESGALGAAERAEEAERGLLRRLHGVEARAQPKSQDDNDAAEDEETGTAAARKA